MDRYLTPNEQDRLLKFLRQQPADDVLAKRDYAVVRALLYSAERIEEFSLTTLGAAIEALRTNYLFIPREIRKGGKQDHMVYMTALLREAIQDLIAVRAELAPAGAHVNDPLVVGRSGKPMTVRNFQQRIKRWGELCNLPAGFSPHWLRHTRAMNIMRSSTAADPRGVVQRVLGHKTISSTGVYTGTSREVVEAELDKIDTRPTRISKAALRRKFERSVCA